MIDCKDKELSVNLSDSPERTRRYFRLNPASIMVGAKTCLARAVGDCLPDLGVDLSIEEACLIAQDRVKSTEEKVEDVVAAWRQTNEWIKKIVGPCQNLEVNNCPFKDLDQIAEEANGRIRGVIVGLYANIPGQYKPWVHAVRVKEVKSDCSGKRVVLCNNGEVYEGAFFERSLRAFADRSPLGLNGWIIQMKERDVTKKGSFSFEKKKKKGVLEKSGTSPFKR